MLSLWFLICSRCDCSINKIFEPKKNGPSFDSITDCIFYGLKEAWNRIVYNMWVVFRLERRRKQIRFQHRIRYMITSWDYAVWVSLLKYESIILRINIWMNSAPFFEDTRGLFGLNNVCGSSDHLVLLNFALCLIFDSFKYLRSFLFPETANSADWKIFYHAKRDVISFIFFSQNVCIFFQNKVDYAISGRGDINLEFLREKF